MDARQHGFFLAKRVHGKDDETWYSEDQPSSQPTTPATPVVDLGFQWVICGLEAFEKGFFDGVESYNRFICFADPSTYPEYPGWSLRNLLVLMEQKWKLSTAQVLCYRDIQARRH